MASIPVKKTDSDASRVMFVSEIKPRLLVPRMSEEWQLRRPEAPIFGRPPRRQKGGKGRRTGPPCLSALARLITPLHPFFLHLSIHPHVIVCVPWAQLDIEAVVLVGLGISNHTPWENKTFLQGGPVLLREYVFGPDLRHSRRRTGPPCLSALCNSLHIISFLFSFFFFFFSLLLPRGAPKYGRLRAP